MQQLEWFPIQIKHHFLNPSHLPKLLAQVVLFLMNSTVVQGKDIVHPPPKPQTFRAGPWASHSRYFTPLLPPSSRIFEMTRVGIIA